MHLMNTNSWSNNSSENAWTASFYNLHNIDICPFTNILPEEYEM